MMRKNKNRVLFASMACVCALAFCGCSSPSIEQNTSAAEEAATPSTASEDALITLTSCWYNNDGECLSNVTVTINNEDQQIYTGTTGEDGSLASCAFPSNTKLEFVILDESGQQLASSYLYYEVSADYENMEITPISDGQTQTLHVPSGSTSILSALYINEDGHIEFANATKNRDNEGASSGTSSELTDSSAVEE